MTRSGLCSRRCCGFFVEEVARFNAADVERLLKAGGVVHNKGKIQAVIQHAAQFREIKKTYGSFQNFLDSQDKSDNYAHVVKN